MAKTIIVKPLGFVLQAAGLVSPKQVQIALQERLSSSNCRLGEIMARHGWISQQTADFFADTWPKLLTQKLNQPLGQYLKAANLIDDAQITNILHQQVINNLKFGQSAVLEGIISQTTLNFFLEQLELIKTSQKNNPQNINLISEQQLADWNRIENHLLYNRQCQPKELFNLYHQIWHAEEIEATYSKAEAELIETGLVVRHCHKIKLAPQLDRYNFSDCWIENQLVRLQPYSKIKIKLFNLDIKATLPYKVLVEVKAWTNNQPFLTHKLYQILRDRESFIPRNQEAKKISQLVQHYIIKDWSTNFAASHLVALSSQLLNPPIDPKFLLTSYLEIRQYQPLIFNNTPEHNYLLEIGLIKLYGNQVKIANRIYDEVFNDLWLRQQIDAHDQVIISLSKPDEELPLALKPTASNVTKLNKNSQLIKFILLLLCCCGIGWVGLSLITQYLELRQFKQANDLLQQQKYSQAIAAYDRLSPSGPTQQHLLWLNKGYAFSGLKQYQDMLQSCSRATSILPRSALAWNCRGEALYYLQDYEKALLAFEQATNSNQQLGIAWINKAQLLFKLGKYQQSLTASEQAIKLIESQQVGMIAIAFNLKGENLLKVNQPQQAIVAFDQALASVSNYPSAIVGKAIALYKLGKYQKAIPLFKQVLANQELSSPQQATIWLYLANCFCQTSKPEYAAAQSAFNKVVLSEDQELQTIARKGCGIR